MPLPRRLTAWPQPPCCIPAAPPSLTAAAQSLPHASHASCPSTALLLLPVTPRCPSGAVLLSHSQAVRQAGSCTWHQAMWQAATSQSQSVPHGAMLQYPGYRHTCASSSHSPTQRPFSCWENPCPHCIWGEAETAGMGRNQPWAATEPAEPSSSFLSPKSRALHPHLALTSSGAGMSGSSTSRG